MKKLNAASILAANDRGIETVPVPEWNGTVDIAIMDGASRDRYEKFCMSKMVSTGKRNKDGDDIQTITDPTDLRSQLLVLTIVDENGERLFTGGDIAKLNKKSGEVLDRLFTIAQKINKLDKNAIKNTEKK